MTKGANLLIVFFILYTFISCGIDEIPVLSKPRKGTAAIIDGYFQFYATENNNEPAFRGFEIYYKFFSTDSTGPVNAGSNYSTVTNLESNNFKRISYYIDDDECDRTTRILKPLMKVPSGKRGIEATITIDFSDLENVHIRSEPDDYFSIPGSPDPVQLPIRRGIEDDENYGYFKAFEHFKSTDPDVTGLETLQDNRLYILVYVLSFGRYNLSETVYSDALCLGYVILSGVVVIE